MTVEGVLRHLVVACVLLVGFTMYGGSVPLPTSPQLDWSKYEIGAIIHFDMGTIQGDQGCSESQMLTEDLPPPTAFNPANVSTDQWMESIVALGAQYAVYIAKHAYGFTTWPTKVRVESIQDEYQYSVSHSSYDGDIVGEFVESCLKYNVKPGLYYSLVQNCYLNVWGGVVYNTSLHENQVYVTQSEFESIALSQLEEIWTEYGDLTEVWFDGGYQQDIVDAISALLEDTQPNSVAFNGFGISKNPIRWVGTESGHAPYPNWSTGTTDGGDPDSTDWCPAECDTTLQNGDKWFYDKWVGLRTLRELQQVSARLCVSDNDTDGQIPDNAVQRYKEFGDWIRNCYGDNGKIVSTSGNTTKLVLLTTKEIDGVTVLGNTKVIATGSSIGNKRIEVLTLPESFKTISLAILSSTDTPLITNFAAHNCASM
ncbi:Alpha-L-fucosidase 1 [Pelomyxa schiedti]|nr:Alpha-L-fucosidase 1 [Pelomyxa schiedti]